MTYEVLIRTRTHTGEAMLMCTKDGTTIADLHLDGLRLRTSEEAKRAIEILIEALSERLEEEIKEEEEKQQRKKEEE